MESRQSQRWRYSDSGCRAFRYFVYTARRFLQRHAGHYIIQSDGTIQGTFSNGQTSALGQIALASFTNEQGLIRNGQNEFLASLSSGQANVGGPGTGAVAHFPAARSSSPMWTLHAVCATDRCERSYQANAKSVTTFDEVTQATLNLKP